MISSPEEMGNARGSPVADFAGVGCVKPVVKNRFTTNWQQALSGALLTFIVRLAVILFRLFICWMLDAFGTRAESR